LARAVSSRHHRSTLLGLPRIVVVALLVLAAASPGLGSSSSGAAAPTGRIIYVHDAAEVGLSRLVVAEVDLGRGRCRRMLTLPPVATAAISPDGRAAAVSIEGRQAVGLRVVTLATGRSRTLRRGGVDLGTAVWSPDGRRLAYLRQRTLRVIGADGRGDRLVARFATGKAAWSPDGTLLAFASTTGDDGTGALRTTLDVITAAGRGRRTLFVDPAPYGSQPAPVWSPDGSVIAFVVSEPVRILAVAATGGAVQALTRGGSPRWSPDGSRISFIGSGPAGIGEVWTMAADGTQKRRLTTSVAPPRGVPKFGSYPGPWSPDGEWLAYGRKWALATMSAEGGSVRARCRLPSGTGFGGAVWVD
jgi:Tol biopolymer transport system component